MSLFRSPRSRPAAGQPDAELTEPVVATARPRPLPTPRPAPAPGGVAGHEDGELDEGEYWDDEYEDEYDDDLEDDEYWDDEYEDEELEEGEYWDDEYEDDLEDGESEEGGHEADGSSGRRRRRRRLLGRGAGARPRRRGRRIRRTPDAPLADDAPVPADAAASTSVPGSTASPTPRPFPTPVPLQKGAPEPSAPRSRRLPRLPVAAMRTGTGRGFTGARTGITRGWTATRGGTARGWRATRHGLAAAVHVVRTHWARAAYIYLGIVAGALLVTFLLYWHSGFTYDECNYCGLPVLLSVSPWWLLILPFNVAQWPLLLPLVVLALFAGLNAELIDRWSKRPQPEYPDWD